MSIYSNLTISLLFIIGQFRLVTPRKPLQDIETFYRRYYINRKFYLNKFLLIIYKIMRNSIFFISEPFPLNGHIWLRGSSVLITRVSKKKTYLIISSGIITRFLLNVAEMWKKITISQLGACSSGSRPYQNLKQFYLNKCLNFPPQGYRHT